MGGISRLSKIAFGTLLAGSLFISSEVSDKKNLNSFNINHQIEINSKDYLNKINLQKDSIEIKNKIKLTKKLEEKLLSFKYLDVVEKNYGGFQSQSIKESIKNERARIASTLNIFKDYSKKIPKKPFSEFTKEEVKDIFLKIDSCITKGPVRIALRKEEVFEQCLGYALNYLAIGETNGFPIYFNFAPPIDKAYHVFVRWDSDGKHDALNPDNPVNKGDFNWDNNSARANYLKIEYGETDENFIDEYFVSKKSIENKVYLRNFNEKEVLAFAYAYTAARYKMDVHSVIAYDEDEVAEKDSLRNSILEKSLYFSNKAIQLDSLCILAYRTKAETLEGIFSLKKLNEAEKTINKALELSPDQEDLIWVKADVYDDRGFKTNWKMGVAPGHPYQEVSFNSDIRKAVELYKKGIEIVNEKSRKAFLKERYLDSYWLEKSKSLAYFSLGLIYSCIGEKEESETWWKKEKELGAILNILKNTANEEYFKREQEISSGE